jgi:hypothetical protein
MFHSSATGRRREQTLPETLGLRQARHPRDDTAGSADSAQKRMVDHGQREHPRGMTAQVAQVEEHEQQPLGNEGHKQGHDGEIPDVSGIQTGKARRALGQKQRQQHTHGSHGSVGRDEDCADVEENRMHLESAYGIWTSAVAIKVFEEGRIRSAGPWSTCW